VQLPLIKARLAKVHCLLAPLIISSKSAASVFNTFKNVHSGLVDNRPAHAKVIRSKEAEDLQRTQAYGGTSGPRLFSG
jgi:hypothetical protein